MTETYEIFNRNCAKMLLPNQLPSSDDTHYPLKTGAAFRQYKKTSQLNTVCSLKV